LPPEEILTSEPTRSARLEWVIVADEAIPAGLMVIAAPVTSRRRR
jgi:hypothetical protein